MLTDKELEKLRNSALVEPQDLIDEIFRLKQAIRAHKEQKASRYDTLDVMLWSAVYE